MTKKSGWLNLFIDSDIYDKMNEEEFKHKKLMKISSPRWN
jgi:hypothetical protein